MAKKALGRLSRKEKKGKGKRGERKKENEETNRFFSLSSFPFFSFLFPHPDRGFWIPGFPEADKFAFPVFEEYTIA